MTCGKCGSDEYLAADPDLWRLGVRPSSQEPATAVHRHLEDMRQIAFKALSLPKPEDD